MSEMQLQNPVSAYCLEIAFKKPHVTWWELRAKEVKLEKVVCFYTLKYIQTRLMVIKMDCTLAEILPGPPALTSNPKLHKGYFSHLENSEFPLSNQKIDYFSY